MRFFKKKKQREVPNQRRTIKMPERNTSVYNGEVASKEWQVRFPDYCPAVIKDDPNIPHTCCNILDEYDYCYKHGKMKNVDT